ncbi:MAG: hypothetical protein B1H03_01295 [Planctomycetales bacterium 4484_113]|nr:MAG: hypothetical protein B1H03_01295 [Planctomycetales bacterium 4484_113]
MEKIELTGTDRERLHAELSARFGGRELMTWERVEPDGKIVVTALPYHQVLEYLQEMAEKICHLIDPYSSLRIQRDRHEPERIEIIIRSHESGAFIGWHGQTLDAIEVLLGAMMGRELGRYLEFEVDIDHYRRKRASFLEALVKRTIQQIEQDHQERPLPGLLPKERRFVHTMLAQHTYLTTESRGRGSQRTLFITPRKDILPPEAP